MPVLASSGVSQARLQQYANQYLNAHRQDEHISAVSITLQYPHHQTPISAYAGYTSYDSQTRIGADHLFHIGSITKSFTSAIILQLDDDPDLDFSINDTIGKFFPQYENWHNITIKQLMNMTSGIPDYILSQDFIDDLIASPYKHRTSMQLIDYSYQLNMRFEPGTQYDYSNTNYILLGMVIEKVTGHSLTHEMKTRLFEPLKLKHTFYFPNELDEKTYPYLVRSYMYKKITNDFIPMGTDTTDFSMSFYGASGGIIANTPDITLWIKELFTPGKILSTRQLQKLTTIVSTKNGESISLPTSQDPNGFGMGIIYSYIPEIDERAYAYEGITFAGRAVYLYVPTRDTIISVTVNSSVDGSKENPDHLKDLILSVYKLTS
jgi:D-alanyl-D-alanine carboxypeptidase